MNIKDEKDVMLKIKKFKCFTLALVGFTGYIIYFLLHDELMDYKILRLIIGLISWGLTGYGCLGYLHYFFSSRNAQKVRIRKRKLWIVSKKT